jgi:hypothetical protein
MEKDIPLSESHLDIHNIKLISIFSGGGSDEFMGSNGRDVTSTHIARCPECTNIILRMQNAIQAMIIGMAQVY